MEQNEARVLYTSIPFHFLPAFLGNKGASGSRGPLQLPAPLQPCDVEWGSGLCPAIVCAGGGERLDRGPRRPDAPSPPWGAFPTACRTYRFMPFGLAGAPVGPGPDRIGYFKKSFESVRPEWGRRVLSLFS